MNTLIERLAAANPVSAPPLDDEAAERLLAELLASPREKTVSRRRRRLLAGALVAAVVAAAAIVLVIASPGQVTLADRAYAAALPGRSVVHEVVVTDWHHLDDAKTLGTERMEAWYHPADGRARRVVHDENGDRIDIVIDARGHLTLRGSDAGPNWTTNDDPAFVRKNATDFLYEFRVAYENGRLDDVGPATFGGRAAEAYVVKYPDGITGETWYVDARTAQPLGDERIFATIGEPGQIVTRRLDVYEKLPATAANLAQLDRPR